MRIDLRPVDTAERLRAEPWWANGVATKLLLTEYLKYIATHARLALSAGRSAYGKVD